MSLELELRPEFIERLDKIEKNGIYHTIPKGMSLLEYIESLPDEE